MAAAGGEGRIVTIDAIRGFAVCGILVMNIVSMGMPVYAYVDPHYYGGAMAGWPRMMDALEAVAARPA